MKKKKVKSCEITDKNGNFKALLVVVNLYYVFSLNNLIDNV